VEQSVVRREVIAVSCDAGTVDAGIAAVESAKEVCPQTDVVVLATDAAAEAFTDVRVVKIEDVDDTPFLTTKILSEGDQLALALPRFIRSLLIEYDACLFLGPGMLLRGDPTDFLDVAADVGVAYGRRVGVRPRYTAAESLGPLDRGPSPVDVRVMAISRKAEELLADWAAVTRDAVLDIDQRPVAFFSDTFLRNSVGRRDVVVEGQGTLVHWTDVAALESGRAHGPDCPIVACDELFADIRVRHDTDDDEEVDWSLLAHKVHDSRPIEGLYRQIRDVQRIAQEIPPETYFDILQAEIRRSADPYGRRWSGADDDGFRAWLFDRNVNGLTRIAHAMTFLDEDLLLRFPNARFDASDLEAWWSREGFDRHGFDAFDRSKGAIVPERSEEDGSSVLNALRWRWVEAQKLLPGAKSREIKRYVKRIVGPDRTRHRGIAEPAGIDVVREPPLWGTSPRELNLLGCFRSESGLGQAARASLEALRYLERDFVAIDTSEKYPSRNSVDVSLTADLYGQHGDVNLIHSNADEMVTLGGGVFKHRFAGRFNAAMWFWETADLPSRSRTALQIVDELWVASEYLKDVFGQYAAVPIHVIGLAADLPEARIARRDEFGWSDDEIVFLFVYDALSSYGRKNPHKALDAFVKAFGPDFNGVRFVLKVSNLNKFPASQREILGLAERYPAITVIDEYLEREEVMDLMASSDIYVSLHAAEGFGLTLLEAMALGTPTICTGYSGNMDFTTDANSWLVDYTMMATDAQTGPYPPGSVWASPDVESVVEIMRSIRRDPSQIRAKAELATFDAREAASLDRYARRLDAELRRVL